MSGKQFQFVTVSHPSETTAWKSTVRSNAARGPRQRQKRIRGVLNPTTKSTINKQSQSATFSDLSLTEKTDSFLLIDVNPVWDIHSSELSPAGGFSQPVSDHDIFLIRYFLNVIIPEPASCRASDSSPDAIIVRKNLAKEWLELSASDSGILTTMLLLSCQSLSVVQGKRNYSLLAMKYRSQCLHDVVQDLEKNGLNANELTFAKTIVLLCDAAMRMDNEASRAHMQAAHEMVLAHKEKMGPGTTEFYHRLLDWFMQSKLDMADCGQKQAIDAPS